MLFGECAREIDDGHGGTGHMYDVSTHRYDFVSWREFSYLDEENLESAQRSEVMFILLPVC